MIIRLITAHMPDGTERTFSSRTKAARELGVDHNYLSLMIKTGTPYCPTSNKGKKALIGMRMTEVVAVTRPVVRIPAKPLCLRCSHLYPFEAKGGHAVRLLPLRQAHRRGAGGLQGLQGRS